MDIGNKIRQLRMKNGLTQEELAARAELTKGFISQVERDITSLSISTLVDVLECLGTNLKDFFSDYEDEKIVFSKEDVFVQEDKELGNTIHWIVPNAQKNEMEPIILTLEPKGSVDVDDPHAGEEFGYVLAGAVMVYLGQRKYKCKKGESFYYKANSPHKIENISGEREAKILWVSTPPSF
ncbi:MAG: cupin domain-containing protein [Peptococcaceae bacterium]|jgi:transcriptional regulator with XRE-family HTH domain|nr:cupin domain-containing protein [Peptococcaceae bacterium]